MYVDSDIGEEAFGDGKKWEVFRAAAVAEWNLNSLSIARSQPGDRLFLSGS